MAASMWRMNWLWRRMAGVLVLCALLLSNEVICQDDSTAAPEVATASLTAGANAATDAAAPDAATPDAAAPAAAAPDAATPGAAAPDASAAPTAADSATAGGQDPAASVVPGDNPFPATIVTVALFPDKMDGGNSGTIVAPSDSNNGIDDVSSVVKLVSPGVKCVGKDDIPESNAVKVVVVTENCEVSKGIIQANPAVWCNTINCTLEIFQDGNNMLVTSEDAKMGTLAEALQSEHLKDKLGVKSTEIPSSSGSSVFVGVLVTGLLAAIATTAGYLKCQRRADPKGVRLAEEAYPVDQENQGNTLVSVAPLNPPPETQEKPSENGESPEAPKTEPAPPPTNGHSTAKTADTEL
ncbi:uncharacterized protein si:dkey-261h17.1 isoform X1 [Hippoglossus hippoglossus]|uniref:uncharacterized protein si:dkey-261h17.1 isoform X1 n=1 Tax=Hippoglossus hippoglossus TaxID=8267 RepID=UPI00148D97A7|nr:uncharacterized protein si:dkey-261h17.1 isoform X1 [Hippoglossus hippoglossus]